MFEYIRFGEPKIFCFITEYFGSHHISCDAFRYANFQTLFEYIRFGEPKIFAIEKLRPITQLVECFPYKETVSGSSPLGSNIFVLRMKRENSSIGRVFGCLPNGCRFKSCFSRIHTSIFFKVLSVKN